MTTTTIAQTVDQDETIQAIHAVLVELSEQQTLLIARRDALSRLLAHRFDANIAVPLAVAEVSIADAGREAVEIDRQLAALARRIDAQYAALEVADFAAQSRILASVMPAYRQLATEADREAFRADLRRRGVFREPYAPDGQR